MINHQIENIWYEFSTDLHRYIRSRVPDDMSADDVLQEVFLKIHAGIGKLRDVKKLQSWIFRIANNAVIDFYRERRMKLQPLPEDLPMMDNAGEKTPAQQLSRGLERMIDALPEKYRAPIKLYVFEGFTQAKIAEHFNISLSGAKSRVQRGRKLLKEMFERCCHFEFDQRGTIIDYHPIECCCCGENCENGC